MKILVVDDEASALSNFFAQVLDDPSLEYKMLKDPEAALEYAKNHMLDAAFLDINMPKIDGIVLAEKLIALYPGIGIVFISGYTQNEDEIAKLLGSNLKGFCYKPYQPDMLYRFLNGIKKQAEYKVTIKTFGLFDVVISGKPIRFSCSKSKELLALLVDKEGANLPLDTSIAYLWPDKMSSLAKKLYRDAVIRLKLTLNKFGMNDLVFFYRAEITLNRSRIQCDFWDALETGDYTAYHDEYMTQYAEWSGEKQAILSRLKADANQ